MTEGAGSRVQGPGCRVQVQGAAFWVRQQASQSRLGGQDLTTSITESS